MMAASTTGATGRRFDVSIRQPGVHRKHRHFDGEGGKERQKDQGLLGPG